MRRLKSLWVDESGVALTEYAIIIAVVGIGLIAVLFFMRNSLGSFFEVTADGLDQPALDPYS
jgi:Flp pilus assembly pilin Flp